MAKPAARLTDLNACLKTGHGTDATTSGSPDALINGPTGVPATLLEFKPQ